MKKDNSLIIFINNKKQTIYPDKKLIKKCIKIYNNFKIK